MQLAKVFKWKNKICQQVKHHLQFHVLDLSQNMCLLYCTRIMRTVLYYYRCINFSFYTWVTCTTHSYHTFNIFPAKFSMVLREKITCNISYSTSKQPSLSCSKQAETLILSMGTTVSDPDCTLSPSSFNKHQDNSSLFTFLKGNLSHHVVKTVKLFLPSDVPVSH